MLLVQVTFGNDGGRPDRREELHHLADIYLDQAQRHGQCDSYFLAWGVDDLTAYTHVPELKSFDEQFHAAPGRATLDEIRALMGRTPAVAVLQFPAHSRIGCWQTAATLYVNAGHDVGGQLVFSGDDGLPTPLYRLPLQTSDCEALNFLAYQYQAFDSVWVASGELEIAAYRQMADPDSPLGRALRGMCRTIEMATGKPT